MTEADRVAERPHGAVTAARLAVVWLAPLLVLAVALRAWTSYPVGAVYDDAVYVAIAKALATGQRLPLPAPAGRTVRRPLPARLSGVPLAALARSRPRFRPTCCCSRWPTRCCVAVAADLAARGSRGSGSRSPRLQAAVAAVVAAIGVPDARAERSGAVGAAVPRRRPAGAAARRARRGRASAASDWLVGAGGVAGAATLVRTHGVALVAAVVLLLVLWRRRYPRGASGTAAGAALRRRPWQWWTAHPRRRTGSAAQGTYGPYLAWWIACHARPADVRSLPRTVGGHDDARIAAMLAVTRRAGVRARRRRTWPRACCSRSARWASGACAGAAPITLALSRVLFRDRSRRGRTRPRGFVWCVWPLLVALPLLGLRALWRWEPSDPVSRRARAVVAGGRGDPGGWVRPLQRPWLLRTPWWETIPRTRAEQLRTVVMKVKGARRRTPCSPAPTTPPSICIPDARPCRAPPAAAAAFLHPLTVRRRCRRYCARSWQAYHVDRRSSPRRVTRPPPPTSWWRTARLCSRSRIASPAA